jgi:hypothetical protein
MRFILSSATAIRYARGMNATKHARLEVSRSSARTGARAVCGGIVMLCAVSLVFCASLGCAGSPRVEDSSRDMSAPLQHVVLVDLADDGDIAAMRAASDAMLPTIPMVKGYVCGAPVDIGRANVHKDYDLGIIVQFDSVADYKAYLEHPVHVELVQTWRPKWKKSFIVDFAP